MYDLIFYNILIAGFKEFFHLALEVHFRRRPFVFPSSSRVRGRGLVRRGPQVHTETTQTNLSFLPS
jgi:hypothetical protein